MPPCANILKMQKYPHPKKIIILGIWSVGKKVLLKKIHSDLTTKHKMVVFQFYLVMLKTNHSFEYKAKENTFDVMEIEEKQKIRH